MNIFDLDINKLPEQHKEICEEFKNYYDTIKFTIDLYNEFEYINEKDFVEYIDDTMEEFLNVLGSSSMILFIYNQLEEYELSAELYGIMKDCFLIIYEKMYINSDNEQFFNELINNMFEIYQENL